MQRSATKLCLHTGPDISHRSTISELQLTYCQFCDQSSFHVIDLKLDTESSLNMQKRVHATAVTASQSMPAVSSACIQCHGQLLQLLRALPSGSIVPFVLFV